MPVKPGVLGRLGVGAPGLLLCALVGIPLGAGAYTYHYGDGFSYFSSDPRG